MKNTDSSSEKIFLVLGIMSTTSGILLAFTDNAIIGISGSIVGLWLVIDNINKIKAKKG